MDDAVLHRERAHPGRLAQERPDVDAGARAVLGGHAVGAERLDEAHVAVGEVVLDDAAHLLLGERRVEVVVEVAVQRRRPRKRPAHPALVGRELVDRCARDRDERDVVVLEVRDRAVEAVGDRRARRAAGREVRAEHEVVDEQLRAPAEEVGQGRRAVLGLEPVLLLDGDPGQRLAPAGELVAAARQLLLGLQHLEAGGEPLLAGGGGVGAHESSSFCVNAMAPAAHIRGRDMGSSATNAAISPRLEPTHQPPKRRPERRSARQRRRHARANGVIS